MSGYQSKKLMANSRDSEPVYKEYLDALAEATDAVENGTPTPEQSLIWLQGQVNAWVLK